jgi:hypothetical protein
MSIIVLSTCPIEKVLLVSSNDEKQWNADRQKPIKRIVSSVLIANAQWIAQQTEFCLE